MPNARLDIVTGQFWDFNGVVDIAGGGVLRLSIPMSQHVDMGASVMMYEGSEFHVSTNYTSRGPITAIDGTISVVGQISNQSGTWIMDGGRIIANEGFFNADETLITIFDGDLNVSGTTTNRGILRIFDGLVLAEDIDNHGLGSWDTAELSLFNTMISALTLHNFPDDLLYGSGNWFVDLTNEGQIFLVDDTTITGDTVNTVDGTITVQAGTLTLFGSLLNDGAIIGNYEEPLLGDSADGMHVRGDYIAGPNAGLFMPGPEMVVRVDGDYDAAIDDNTRYDMLQATLEVKRAGRVRGGAGTDEQGHLARAPPG